METFSGVELEYIAQSSFAYWDACRNEEITDRDEMRHGMALREVARYFDAANEDQELVVEALKRTCKYRKEYRIDLLRSCFDDSIEYDNEKDEEIAERYRTMISKDLAKQPMVVKSGATGRGVLEVGARCCTDKNDERFVLTVIYMIERSIASTESLSRGTETMMDVVFDASCFSSKHAPSRTALKKLTRILQNQYPQRLNTLVVLDPPFWLSTLYSIISTFVDSRTRNKFQLARGCKAKNAALGKVLRFPSNADEDSAQIAATTPFQIPLDSLRKSALLLSQ